MKRFLLFLFLALTLGSVGAWAETFKLVTSESDIEVGGEYLIVHKAKSWAMGAQNGNYRSYVSVTIDGDKIEIANEAVSVVTIEESGNANFPYMLSVSDAGTKEYLYNGGSTSNYLKTTSSKTTQTAFSSISLGSEGVAIIKFNKQNKNSVNFQLQVNDVNGADRFSCYANTQTNCYLYKKESNLTPVTLSFEYAAYEVTEGESLNVAVQDAPEGSTVSYTSSNTDLATVDESTGTVKALKPGEVTITAKSTATEVYAAGEASYTLKIKKQIVEVNPVFAPTSIEIKQGGEFTVTPENFFAGVSNLEISTESKIIDILGEVDTWLFEANAEGTATINVSWEDGTEYKAGSATFEFTVTPLGELEAPTFSHTDGEYPISEVVTISGPEGAKIYYGEGTTEEDAINEGNEFMLEELGEHTFVAYAYDEENKRKSQLATAKYTVVKGKPNFSYEQAAFTATMGGEAQALNNPGNLPYTLTSSNPEVAIVSPKDGQSIWMLKPGTATITATAAATETTNEETVSYELTVVKEPGQLVSSEVNVTFDFTTEKPYGITPTNSSSTYNFKQGHKISEGDVTLTSGGENRLWAHKYGNELRVMKNQSFTIAVPEGCTINSVKLYKGPGNSFTASPVGIVLTEKTEGSTTYYEWAPASKFSTFPFTCGEDVRTDIAKIEVNYTGMVEGDPAHCSVNLAFDGDREVLVEAETMVEAASVAADVAGAVEYDVLDKDGNVLEDSFVAKFNGEKLEITAVDAAVGEYVLRAYVAPTESYYPAVVTTPLFVRNVICPENLYMHGHFYNRYYDLSNPVEMTREEGTKVFTANGIYIGGNADVTDGDLGYVFTSHYLTTATDAPAAAPARAAVHQSNWAQLEDGYVFDSNGAHKANTINTQDDVTPHIAKEGVGYYNVTVDMKDAEHPVVTALHTGTTTGVEGVTVADDAAAVYYDLQGKRVANPERGLYIRVAGGKAEKVMLR
ncbi:MAG: Ig-like domain-containing protein [Muribaculaceae bacterium]|nr:Ig-like domain-containing protein [Muribaculaceae bacterium]